ncbi:hypothetical protein LTR05_005781 [Lithohypha guttulata]|uniref:Uncharacterized protein n=1 Tax=Lithohypha guttulata TaxID=1690604 RepID=A0AAN7YGB6_9EURO|nr:hypothetical protein LTR05_005781 [Lithohypha guttulata]
MTAILKASLTLPIAEGISELKWQWFEKPRTLSDISTFDSASRGPWGSFLFLFSIRRSVLASCGAIITICALAIDPFSQQVLKYQNCLEPNTAAMAQIPRTNAYSARGLRAGAGVTVLDTTMTLSIYNGILAPLTNASSLVATSCPSGNCTFSADAGSSYSSIAICQRYVLSSNVIDYRYSEDLAIYQSPEDEYLKDMLFTTEFLMLRNFTQPIAYRSSLYPCIKTWGGNITLGKLVEIETASVPAEFVDGYVSQVAKETLRNGSRQACQPTTQETDINVISVKAHSRSYADSPINVTSVSNIPNDTILWYPPDCIWKFDAISANANTEFLRTLFLFNNVSRADRGGAILGDLWLLNIWANGLANMSSVNDYMDNLAAHMTATIRSRGDETTLPYTNYASGIVLENQTCIHVRWSWLALPSSLVVCSVLFLTATIVSTSARRHESYAHASLTAAGPLKSSPLPLLFHGIEPSTLHALDHPGNLADMQRIAGGLEFRLGRSLADENWYFVHDKQQ